MARAAQATIDLLNDYFAAMETKDVARLGDFYADDITLKFANAPLVTGREAMLARMVDLLGRVRSLAHVPVNVWEEDGGVLLPEVDSIWTLLDGTVTTIRACSVFTLADGRFVDQRIYVDNAPVEPALGYEAASAG
jgi:ketosteroid isomerase-like protein